FLSRPTTRCRRTGYDGVMVSLGELERNVMDTLWSASGPLTVRQVHDHLSLERKLAYTTVMTVLDRLAHKALVKRTRSGRAYTHIPARTREELTANLMHEALRSAGDDRTSALVRFAETVSVQEAAALREALEDIEEDPPTS